MSLGIDTPKQAVRQQSARTFTVPAPIGGVNARDALASMPLTDAIVMDNWFCTPGYIQPRGGSISWSTGLGAAVESVMGWTGTSVNKLFGVAAGKIYDSSAQGASVVTVVTTLLSSRVQHQLFNSGSGTILIWANGSDAPMYFDNGTQGALSLISITSGGSAYTNGTYTAVPLTGGSGTGAQATVVVSGAIVTSVTITTRGSGYHVGDTLSAAAANIGGTGSGLAISVLTIGGWSTTTIAGTNSITGAALVPANLITVTVHQQRCWFIEKNTMNVWYAAASAFQGTLIMLPLGQLFTRGGFLMQMASWTIDNVEGINAYAAFITSEGEVAIYQGYDPAQQSTWSLVGVFKIGRPIGRRCICKLGADVLCITVDGLTPLSKGLLTDRSQPETLLTFKIRNAINQDVLNYSGNFGWQVIEYPTGTKIILNVPETTDTTAHQWVKNTVRQDDGGWSRFRNWNANCWEVQQDSLYYGGNGTIFLADTGITDAGGPITVDCLPAYSEMEVPGLLKNFEFARPIFQASSNVQPTITLNVDYQNISPASVPLLTGNTATWDVSLWDVTPWGDIAPSITIKSQQGIAGYGYAASGRITMQISNIAYQWFSTTYLFEVGGPV